MGLSLIGTVIAERGQLVSLWNAETGEGWLPRGRDQDQETERDQEFRQIELAILPQGMVLTTNCQGVSLKIFFCELSLFKGEFFEKKNDQKANLKTLFR